MNSNPEYFLQNYGELLTCANNNRFGITDFPDKRKTTRPFRISHGIFGWFPPFGR